MDLRPTGRSLMCTQPNLRFPYVGDSRVKAPWIAEATPHVVGSVLLEGLQVPVFVLRFRVRKLPFSEDSGYEAVCRKRFCGR